MQEAVFSLMISLTLQFPFCLPAKSEEKQLKAATQFTWLFFP